MQVTTEHMGCVYGGCNTNAHSGMGTHVAGCKRLTRPHTAQESALHLGGRGSLDVTEQCHAPHDPVVGVGVAGVRRVTGVT